MSTACVVVVISKIHVENWCLKATDGKQWFRESSLGLPLEWCYWYIAVTTVTLSAVGGSCSSECALSRTSQYDSEERIPSVLWRCWLGGRKGIRPVKTEWWGALERGADLHMAQLMPLPLTVSCFGKIQAGFHLSGVPAHLGRPGKGPLNVWWWWWRWWCYVLGK